MAYCEWPHACPSPCPTHIKRLRLLRALRWCQCPESMKCLQNGRLSSAVALRTTSDGRQLLYQLSTTPGNTLAGALPEMKFLTLLMHISDCIPYCVKCFLVLTCSLRSMVSSQSRPLRKMSLLSSNALCELSWAAGHLIAYFSKTDGAIAGFLSLCLVK